MNTKRRIGLSTKSIEKDTYDRTTFVSEMVNNLVVRSFLMFVVSVLCTFHF